MWQKRGWIHFYSWSKTTNETVGDAFLPEHSADELQGHVPFSKTGKTKQRFLFLRFVHDRLPPDTTVKSELNTLETLPVFILHFLNIILAFFYNK